MFNRLVGKVLFGGLLLTSVTILADSSDTKHDDAKPIVGNSGLKLSQAEVLREFEAESEKEYTLGAGDEIDIQVPGQPELERHHVVGPDGRITLQLVGPMLVAGQSREHAAQMITKAWEQYYSTISVTVQVTKYGSNKIVVVGHVTSPGPQSFDTPPTLLEALSKSGAYSARPTEPTASAAAKSGAPPSATLTRCAIYRGSEQVLWIDMNQLFASGNGVDLHLRRDDVVFVPEEQDTLVSVLGQVAHPGAIRITSQTKLTDLIAMAGGLTDDAAAKNIRLVRASTNTVREFALNDLLDPAKAHMLEASLQSGDVVYVPKSGMGKVGYVLNKFAPAGTLMMFGASVTR